MSKLHIAEDLSLPSEAVTQTFGILGIRGSGKTNTARVMAEEMHGAGLPMVVVDPVGAWYGLRSSRDGRGPGLPLPIFGGRHGDVPLERTGGALLADLVADQRLSCILDISELSEGDKIRFLIDFGERLYRRNQDPLHLFLEEADDYAPQRPMREQARLLRVWENVVRRGRIRGLGVTMITQRSAALNKNVLTQIETLVVHRTTSPQDRKAIEGWVEYHGQSEELLESLPALKDGEAWVWSPHWMGKLVRTRIRLSETFDSGATPKDVKRRAPATLADVDLKAISARMSETIERAKAENPKELRRRIADLERELRAKPQAAAEVERVEVPVVKDDQVRRIEVALGGVGPALESLGGHVQGLQRFGEMIRQATGDLAAAIAKVSGNGKGPVRDRVRSGGRHPVPAPVRPHRAPARALAGVAVREKPRVVAEGLSHKQQLILNALAELELIGAHDPPRELIAFLAGYTNLQSKGFVNAVSGLRTAGLIEYGEGSARLTDAGRTNADYPERPRSAEEVQERVIGLLGGASARILQPLIEAYPKAMPREEVAQRAGYSNLQSKGFVNAVSRLRTLGFIDYPDRGSMVAQPVLFLEE